MIWTDPSSSSVKDGFGEGSSWGRGVIKVVAVRMERRGLFSNCW